MIEHVRAWADAPRVRAAPGRSAEPRDRRAGDAGARVGAEGDAPGSPRHGLRAPARQPERPDRGPDRARARRRVADRERHHARRRRRRCDRRDDGAGRGRVAPARPARAADDGRRGGRPRRGQWARRLARQRQDLRQPRQRGGRQADGRLRGQHRHLGADRAGARAAWRRSGHALGHGQRRPRRPLGHEHPARPLERGQGARARAARGVRDRAVPARLARRRQEPQRDPARRPGGGLRELGRRGRACARRSRRATATIRDVLRQDRQGRHRRGGHGTRREPTHGRRRARPRCWTRWRSSRPARSR